MIIWIFVQSGPKWRWMHDRHPAVADPAAESVRVSRYHGNLRGNDVGYSGVGWRSQRSVQRDYDRLPKRYNAGTNEIILEIVTG